VSTTTFDLGRLALTSGEGRRFHVDVDLDAFSFAGERYEVAPARVPVTLDVARMLHGGWSLRLRFTAHIAGPCMRCLAAASPAIEVDSREVHQPGAGADELDSPYIADDELELGAWARDALALALPTQILCRPECAGLCPECGENLNEHPHEHERAPDPRWSKLSELKLE
jgi:DUF177 domain-containing protein